MDCYESALAEFNIILWRKTIRKVETQYRLFRDCKHSLLSEISLEYLLMIKYISALNKFFNFNEMLCNFPVEIIEEILLYLGIHDLISTIKMNRQLYSIAHSEKTPLRHRLGKRIYAVGG